MYFILKKKANTTFFVISLLLFFSIVTIVFSIDYFIETQYLSLNNCEVLSV